MPTGQPLSNTSALVLMYDEGASYQTPKAKDFYRHLNLKPGAKLYQKLSHLSHTDQVIKGRKYGIQTFVENFLKQQGSLAQVIFLGCGWDPVLVKMGEQFPKNLFIGLDQDIVGPKELAKQILPSANIRYIRWDLKHSNNLPEKLIETGWQPNKAFCLVLEGLIYYIPPKALINIISVLKNYSSSKLYLAGDYLVDLQDKALSPRAKKMGQDIFDTIKKDCNLKAYYMYSREQLAKTLRQLDLFVEFMDIHTINKKRTGQSEFKKQKDCHIDLFFAGLSPTVPLP